MTDNLANANSMPNNDLAVGDLLHLPELSAKDLTRATAEESVAWLWGTLGRWRPGDLWNDFEGLITLQKASLDTVRCVRVHDYGGCYWYLSMLRATCSKAGITLDLHMTLVTPLMNGEDAWRQPTEWVARNVGAVLQDMPAEFPLTVRDVVAYQITVFSCVKSKKFVVSTVC